MARKARRRKEVKRVSACERDFECERGVYATQANEFSDHTKPAMGLGRVKTQREIAEGWKDKRRREQLRKGDADIYIHTYIYIYNLYRYITWHVNKYVRV